MKSIVLFLSFLITQQIFAQSKLPVIKATSKSVSIKMAVILIKMHGHFRQRQGLMFLLRIGPGKPNGLHFIPMLIPSG
jgi:hypothetical protein